MVAALVAPEGDAPGERRAIAERLRRELDARLQTVTVRRTLFPTPIESSDAVIDTRRSAAARCDLSTRSAAADAVDDNAISVTIEKIHPFFITIAPDIE